MNYPRRITADELTRLRGRSGVLYYTDNADGSVSHYFWAGSQFKPCAPFTGVEASGLRAVVSAHWKSTAQTLGVVGDSRLANGWATATYGGRNSLAEGLHTWVELLSSGKVRMPSALNYAVAGETSAQILARIETAADAISAGGAGAALVLCSTNDRVNSLTADESISNLTAIASALKARGLGVIWCNETPRGDGTYTGLALTGDQLAYHAAVSRWIARRPYTTLGEYVADTWGATIADASASDGYAVLGDTYDGLHPTPIMARKIAAAIVAVTDSLWPSAAPRAVGGIDAYSAANPTGNPFPNPGFAGSTAVSGTGNTGNVPTSWTAGAASPTGMATAYSVAAVGTRRKVTMTLSGTSPASANTGWYLLTNYQGTIPAGLAIGSKWRVTWPVSWSGLANIRDIEARILTNIGSRTAPLNQNNRPWPQDDMAGGALVLDDFEIPAGSTVAQLSLRVVLAAGSTTSAGVIVADAPIVERVG